MATGMERAQELLGDTKCDLCDTYKNVSWECQNCEQILCQQCKISHLRSRFSRNHIVTELEGSRDGTQGSSIFCPDHEDEAFQMFCTTCNTVVCFDCITGKHKGHEYKKIKEVANPVQTQLQDIFKQIKTQQIPKLERSLVSITNMQLNYSQEIDRAVTEIRTTGDELKQEITNIHDRLIDELMKHATKDEKCLSDKTEQLDLKLNTLKEQLKNHDKKMKRFTDIDIIAKATSIKTSLSQLSGSPDMPKLKPLTFQTGEFNNTCLENMYGKIILQQEPAELQTEGPEYSRKERNLTDENVEQEKHKSKDTRVIKGNVVSSFTWRTDLKTIEITNQNEAWMLTYGLSHNDRYLELVNDQGNRITAIKLNVFGIYDMAATISGDLMVIEGKQIQLVSKSGGIDTFADLSPYYTWGIHVVENGDVLVGLFDRDKYKSRVTRLSSTGQTLQVIDNIKKDVDMDTPHRIKENVNHDIVMICDWSYILVVNKAGRYRFTYTGPPTTIKMTGAFNPTDIICNQSGQILVADKNNSTIHLLDQDGTFLEFILTKHHGIEEPRALAIDHSGKIWVGCYNGKVFIVE